MVALSAIKTDSRGKKITRLGRGNPQQHVTFRIAPEDLRLIDEIAEQEGINRSAFLKKAIWSFLENKRK